MIKQEILDNHIIYGDWDDCVNNQFMVYYHPNGIDCVVFIFSGQDYGGGIFYWFNSKSETIDKIVGRENMYDRVAKEEIENLPEAKAKRKLDKIHNSGDE